MELRDIQYFAVVAEHGNVRRASEALGLSPGALSKSLRRLEESLKAKLVERTPKGVALTSVGAALLSQVQRLRVTMLPSPGNAITIETWRVPRLGAKSAATMSER